VALLLNPRRAPLFRRVLPAPRHARPPCFVAGVRAIPTHRIFNARTCGENRLVQARERHRVAIDRWSVRDGVVTMMGTTRANRGATGRPASRNGVGKKVRRILDPASPAE
ncbi:unnamed protein product, partial [Laminaria digitata]